MDEEDKAARFSHEAFAAERTPTFRKGQIGGWREAFTEAHKEAFKATAGDLLVQLGYEADLGW